MNKETTPLESVRRQYFTPEKTDQLLNRFNVPEDCRQLMKNILDLHVTFGGTPKEFGKKAGEYMRTHNIDPIIARTCKMIYQQIVVLSYREMDKKEGAN